METKQGVKTSEFWTAVLSAALGAVPAVLAALRDQPVAAAIAGAIALAGPVVYIWGRSILKAERARQTDLLPDAWEERLSDVLDGVERLTQAVRAAREGKL